MITKIVSGGQTGADRGGLEAAIYCDVPHGGWCPNGRKAEDGTIPAQYCLQETRSSDYAVRTEANVVDSDATLVFSKGAPTGGTLLTIKCAEKHGKSCHLANLRNNRRDIVEGILRWLAGEIEEDEWPAPTKNLVLNVAGSRESKVSGIERAVTIVLVDVLTKTNPACKSFYPLTSKESILCEGAK